MKKTVSLFITTIVTLFIISNALSALTKQEAKREWQKRTLKALQFHGACMNAAVKKYQRMVNEKNVDKEKAKLVQRYDILLCTIKKHRALLKTIKDLGADLFGRTKREKSLKANRKILKIYLKRLKHLKMKLKRLYSEDNQGAEEQSSRNNSRINYKNLSKREAKLELRKTIKQYIELIRQCKHKVFAKCNRLSKSNQATEKEIELIKKIGSAECDIKGHLFGIKSVKRLWAIIYGKDKEQRALKFAHKKIRELKDKIRKYKAELQSLR